MLAVVDGVTVATRTDDDGAYVFAAVPAGVGQLVARRTFASDDGAGSAIRSVRALRVIGGAENLVNLCE